MQERFFGGGNTGHKKRSPPVSRPVLGKLLHKTGSTGVKRCVRLYHTNLGEVGGGFPIGYTGRRGVTGKKWRMQGSRPGD